MISPDIWVGKFSLSARALQIFGELPVNLRGLCLFDGDFLAGWLGGVSVICAE